MFISFTSLFIIALIYDTLNDKSVPMSHEEKTILEELKKERAEQRLLSKKIEKERFEKERYEKHIKAIAEFEKKAITSKL